MRRQLGEVPEAPYERVMMTFVNMDSPGLVILPTHRIVFGLEDFAIDSTMERLKKYFTIEQLSPSLDVKVATDRLREAGKDRTAFLALTANSTFLLRALPSQQSDSLLGQTERQRTLDVVQLHKLVLEETLGMSEEDIRDQKHLKYLREAQEAADEVRRGANVAFLMKPVRMEQVRDIAFSGEVLPQKSTDFFPKLLSGLAIYSLEDAAQVAGAGGH
jgi:uncharacterized protein (DUF1015 family)